MGFFYRKYIFTKCKSKVLTFTFGNVGIFYDYHEAIMLHVSSGWFGCVCVSFTELKPGLQLSAVMFYWQRSVLLLFIV